MAEQNALHDLFLDELRDVYHAEKQITKALPKMMKAASSDSLKNALQMHLEETQEQIERLERVFSELDERAKGKTCQGMEGIIEEGREVLEKDIEDSAMDAAIIAAAQRVEHYEIAAYGTLVEWARTLGRDEVVELLETTLSEEKAADEKLSQIAEREVNQRAANGAAADEEEPEPIRRRPAPMSARGGRGMAANRR